MKTNEIKFKIRPEFRMTENEITFMDGLPENLPETKLTQKQKDEVNRIYHRYISNKVYKGWGTELWKVEQQEKWPSGPRVKEIEAKRFVLEWLAYDCKTRPEMTADEAAKHFYASLTSRECMAILTRNIYEEIRDN